MAEFPTWALWMAGTVAVIAFVFAWSALALASRTDDMHDRLRDEQRRRDALSRAVEQARTEPTGGPS